MYLKMAKNKDQKKSTKDLKAIKQEKIQKKLEEKQTKKRNG